MCGIKTNTEALRLAHVCDDVGDLLETVSETGALAGCGLECDSGLHFWNFSEDAIDRFHDLIQAGLLAGAEVRARMQNQKRKLELIGSG